MIVLFWLMSFFGFLAAVGMTIDALFFLHNTESKTYEILDKATRVSLFFFVCFACLLGIRVVYTMFLTIK